jgi:glutathione peroxidase-family protein
MSLSAFGASSLHEFTLQSIDGKPFSLADLKGKAVLVVNVASRCGYTPQYAGLQSLYAKYKDKGLVILGVPANNFGGQEPGSNEEIKTFCSRNYNVTFPMLAKVSVKGADQTPLYGWLTSEAANKNTANRCSVSNPASAPTHRNSPWPSKKPCAELPLSRGRASSASPVRRSSP